MTDYRSALILMPQDDKPGGKRRKSPFDTWLAEAGWDPRAQVLRPESTHETLGWKECAVNGCVRPAWGVKSRGLCSGCLGVWRARGQPDFDKFCEKPRRRVEYQLSELCEVTRNGRQCRQPANCNGLCKRHADTVRHHMKSNGRTREEAVKICAPFGFGAPCQVLACDRPAQMVTLGLCVAHRARWQRIQGEGSSMSFEEYCRRTSQVTDGRIVVFTGLEPRVARQILFGVYTRSRRGSLTRTMHLQQIVDYVRQLEVSDLREVKDQPRPDVWPRSTTQPLLNTILKAVEYGDCTPEDFRHADIWPGAVFGMNSQVDFRGISQPWLRRITQAWCWDNLHRFGDFTTFIKMVNEINYFSEYLHDHAKAHGTRLSELDRAVVSGFAAHVAELVRTSAPRARYNVERGGQNLRFTWKKGAQIGCLLSVQRLLRYGRETDMMEHCPGSFMITEDLLPRRGYTQETESGRSLPVEIVRQLFASENLAALETMAAEYPRLLRILGETGRRPSEITSLRYDCIDNGPGGPFLIYTETKVTSGEVRKVPVLTAVVDTVRAQQAHARARFPNTEPADLALFPRLTMNSHGYHGTHPSTFGHTFNNWIRALPKLESDEIGSDGKPLAYDRSLISAYSFRHTYAQRHADVGTPPDVLKQLMGHESILTTMGYYRITQQRRREAAELVGNLVVDKGSLAIRPMTKSHQLANEHASIAVPFGKCSNPQNVAAEGHGCPIRHRCFGCASFSSDPSYLPEMRRRLLDLKAMRARIDAFKGAQEWAKRDARPSDEEIRALQRRIRTEEGKLAKATPEQRALIDEAANTLRKARAAATVDLKLTRREEIDDSWTSYTDERRHAIDTLGKLTND